MAIYFPVLRWKQGEREALRNLTDEVKRQISPIFEFPPNCVQQDKKITDFHETAVKDWGTEFPFYLDISYVDSCGVSSESLLKRIHQQNLVCTPVHNLQNGRESLEVILQSFRSGYCSSFAIRVNENVADRQIDEVINTIRGRGIREEQFDLIADLRDTSSGQNQAKMRLLQAIVGKMGTAYSTTILLSGAVPSFETDEIGTDKSKMIERYDWALWNESRRIPGLSHIRFGDYATITCEFRESKYQGAPKVKYTTPDNWYIIKGHKARANEDQRKYQATSITESRFYRGQQYSYGDMRIFQCKSGTWGPGNPTNWVTNDVNQHITFVVSQVASSLSAP